MTKQEHTLQTLARLDPDYLAFAAALPPEMTDAIEPLPEGLADDVIALLQEERSELSGWFAAQSTPAPPDRFILDPLTAAGTLTAILFLLRSHIKIEGKYFSFEHKPMESDLLKSVLDKLGFFMDPKLKP
ncbi:MAG: hypothetical protein LBB91_05940 [Clostridiales bacterium]|jgi:hypothetical protein|nr:hypothetical protein [Clostridiales bacterium]